MICVPSKPSTILLPGCAYARIMKPVPAKCCGAAPVVARIGFGKPCAWRPPLYTTRKAIWATNTGAYAPDWERQKPLPPWRTNWPESFGLSLPAKSHLIRVSLLTMKRLMSSAGSSVFRLQPGKWAINSPQSPHENQASLAQPSWVIPPCSSRGCGRQDKEPQEAAAASASPEQLAYFLVADPAVSGAMKDFNLFPGDAGVLIDLFGREGFFGVITRAWTLVGHTQPQVFASPGNENGAIESLTESCFVAEGPIADGDEQLLLEAVPVKALTQFA